jgi:beta-glucanase (GH16 family)
MKKEYSKNKLPYFLFFISFQLFSIYNYAQVNLINNFDFENVSLSWTFAEGASRVKSDPKSGDYALSATSNSGAEQTISGLLPNTTYLLSGWLKSTNSKPVTFGVKYFGGNKLTVQTASSVYTQLSFKFSTGPASSTAVIFVNNASGNNTVMWADDLSLTYTSETPYTLVWSDEFNGNGAVDSTNWNFEKGFVRNEELQWYQTENASQQDGNLIFEGRKENPFNGRLNPNYKKNSKDWKKSRQYINYTASSITTKGKQSWLYGRFEIRAKVTNQTGTWPAIWTLGNDCEWPYNGEVDIMENYGENILANFAWGTNKRWKAKWDTVRLNTIKTFVDKDPDWLSKFHIWSMDWDENRMSIYLDGVLLNDVDLNTTINGKYNCSGQNPFKQKHYLLLNLALGGQGGSVESLSFPTQYIVDYVRVYQLNTSMSNN